MSDDRDAKKVILARRARFVAAAVATVGIACGKEPKEPPMPCLSVAYVPPDAEPLPCLSPPLPEPIDAGVAPVVSDAGPSDAGSTDAGSRDGGVKDAKPRPPSPTPKPMPCLSVAPRVDEPKK